LKSSPLLVGSPAASKLYMLTRGERYWQAPTVVCVCVSTPWRCQILYVCVCRLYNTHETVHAHTVNKLWKPSWPDPCVCVKTGKKTVQIESRKKKKKRKKSSRVSGGWFNFNRIGRRGRWPRCHPYSLLAIFLRRGDEGDWLFYLYFFFLDLKTPITKMGIHMLSSSSIVCIVFSADIFMPKG
jgi:hypothetical protein